MEQRPLGKSGPMVSVIGYGCGAVGGLMVRGDPADQERAVARALELGITYFDTAPAYGDGASERNLGRVLAKLRPQIVLGTKFRIPPGTPPASVEATIAASLEASLRRLGRERVDLFQLHNPIAEAGPAESDAVPLPPALVVGQVLPALERLRRQGKFDWFGFTAIGVTEALLRVAATAGPVAAQVPYNLLNPSAGRPVPPGFPAQDFGQVMLRAREHGIGTIGIRVLAGGALSATAARHPIAAASVAPIGSGADYAADVASAQPFAALARQAGLAGPTALAIRFAISHPAMSTALVGLATAEQLEAAAAAAAQGPLPDDLLRRIRALEDGAAA
jgi:L-galactose dehydrogenase/L-glyceraldehyde 3-phosphate reductase